MVQLVVRNVHDWVRYDAQHCVPYLDCLPGPALVGSALVVAGAMRAWAAAADAAACSAASRFCRTASRPFFSGGVQIRPVSSVELLGSGKQAISSGSMSICSTAAVEFWAEGQSLVFIRRLQQAACWASAGAMA